MNKTLFFLYIISAFLFASCKTRNQTDNLGYLKNVEETVIASTINKPPLTIQNGDEIYITVSAKNMDVVKPFNQNYFSGEKSASTIVPENNKVTEKSYLVNNEGKIDFPILGLITTTNLTLEDLKTELTNKISTYVKNPIVTLRLANFKITILGEISKPGLYTITGNDTTLLNAIGLAGDLTMYGKRNDILIVRNVNGVTTKQRIDLADANLINSDYYMLKQGDVIYISPSQSKEKTARQDPNTSIYIAVAGTLVGLAGIFITIFKK